MTHPNPDMQCDQSDPFLIQYTHNVTEHASERVLPANYSIEYSSASEVDVCGFSYSFRKEQFKCNYYKFESVSLLSYIQSCHCFLNFVDIEYQGKKLPLHCQHARRVIFHSRSIDKAIFLSEINQ